MKTYVANYSDARGNSWDLFITAENYKDAVKEGRKAAHGLMAGCKFEGVHIKK